LADLRVNLEMNLYFAPYIMSLIKAKTRFRGVCEVKHLPFRLLKNDTAFIERHLTPFPDDVVNEEENVIEGEARNEGANVDQQAMPPPSPMQVTLIHILPTCSRASTISLID
jgi:hypothetical protein